MNLNRIIGYFEGLRDYIRVLTWPANATDNKNQAFSQHTIMKPVILCINVLFVSGKVRKRKQERD